MPCWDNLVKVQWPNLQREVQPVTGIGRSKGRISGQKRAWAIFSGLKQHKMVPSEKSEGHALDIFLSDAVVVPSGVIHLMEM